jgi:hypothetical protein
VVREALGLPRDARGSLSAWGRTKTREEVAEALESIGGMDAHDRAVRVHAAPHPGAALLGEHRKEIDRWQESVDEVRAERDTERRLRMEQAVEHRNRLVAQQKAHHEELLRVAVRARNEGLEKAAQACDALARRTEEAVGMGTPRGVGLRSVAHDIRAMKETEG